MELGLQSLSDAPSIGRRVERRSGLMLKRRIFLLVLVLGVGELAFAQTPPPGGVDFVRGQQALRKRDTAAAIQSFETAVRDNPDLLMAHYYLGFAYQGETNWDKAGENFEAFLQRVDRDDPLTTELVYHAARQGGFALARTASFRNAVPYLEEVISAKPDDKQAHFFMGVALLRSGDRMGALFEFNRVITLDSAYADALYYAGQICSSWRIVPPRAVDSKASSGSTHTRRMSQMLTSL